MLATLVITIAAVTTMFSLVDQVLLRPLPVPSPDELVSVEVSSTRTGETERSESVSHATFRGWQDASPEGSQLAWAVIESSVLTETEIGVYSAGYLVSHNFLETIGVAPSMGRWFADEDAGAPVVAISYDMWQRDLGGDANVIGRTISLDDLPFTVIAVMPQGYLKFLEPRVRYWRPVADFGRGGSVIARLPRGATSAYEERLTSVLDRVLQRDAGDYAVRLVSLQDRLVGVTRANLWLLMAGVSALFLVAILNLTNLTFAQFHSRAHELATRVSLGATAGRLVRQLVAENLILSAIAAAASAFATVWLLELVLLMIPDSFPRKTEIVLDAWAFGFALCMAVASGFLVTLIPSLRLAKPARLIEQMKHGGGRVAGSFGSIGLRRRLITAQVGVALTLLVAVGLLLRSYANLLDQDIGFEPERVVTGHIWRPEGRSDSEISIAFDRVLDEIRALPDVSLVAAGSTIPMGPIATRVDPTVGYSYSGQPPLREGEENRVALRTVTDDFFRVLSIPLAAGRFFDTRERSAPNRTLIVNRAMADHVWPDRDPIGRELRLNRRGGEVAYTVVGVVENNRFDGLNASVKPEIFLSMSQEVFGGASYVAKIDAGNAAATMQTIARIASGLDSSMPMIEVHLMNDLVRGTVDDRQSALILLAGFASFAILLAGVGIYGLTSYLIGCRAREIAIRMALGATQTSIRRWVMKDALIPAVLGALLGLALTFPLGKLLAGFLFGVEPWDGLAYAGALLVVVAVSVLAPIGPARRAAGLEATRALRAE